MPLVVEKLPQTGRFVLIAESFSGPLAVLAASTCPQGLDAVVLCNTFVEPPRCRCYAWLPFQWLFRLPPPDWALRQFLVGPGTPRSLCGEIRAAVTSVAPSVLSHRLREVLTVDVGEEPRQLPFPIMELCGMGDRLVSARALERGLGQRQNVTHARVEGPHLLLQVAPEECWGMIGQFLGIT